MTTKPTPAAARPTHVRSTPGVNVASCGARAGEGEKPLKFVMSVRLASCPGCIERRGRTIKERTGTSRPRVAAGAQPWGIR